jgi:hypothetical protein
MKSEESDCRSDRKDREEMTAPMTPEEECAFYAQPENQAAAGTARGSAVVTWTSSYKPSATSRWKSAAGR